MIITVVMYLIASYYSGINENKVKQSQEDTIRFIIMAFAFIPVGIYLFWLNSKILNDFYIQLKKNLSRKDDFKLILDSLEESIIIINDNKIDFVNDMFLNQFRNSIYRIKSNLIQSSEHLSSQKLSYKTKILNKLKWYRKCIKKKKNDESELSDTELNKKQLHIFLESPMFRELYEKPQI